MGRLKQSISPDLLRIPLQLNIPLLSLHR